MKNYFLFLSFLFICLGSSSCTVLQWRKTDAEIQQTFNKQNIATEISYYKVDSLGVNVRVQSVVSEKCLGGISRLWFPGALTSVSR